MSCLLMIFIQLGNNNNDDTVLYCTVLNDDDERTIVAAFISSLSLPPPFYFASVVVLHDDVARTNGTNCWSDHNNVILCATDLTQNDKLDIKIDVFAAEAVVVGIIFSSTAWCCSWCFLLSALFLF